MIRDRDGEFEPQLVKKHQTDISAIEDKIIFLYSQGVSTREIKKTMQEMYGINVDDSRVSKITDKILPLIKEWQERPLQSVYAKELAEVKATLEKVMRFIDFMGLSEKLNKFLHQNRKRNKYIER